VFDGAKQTGCLCLLLPAGNRPEELPELMLAAGRVYRLDFSKARPFPAKSVDELGNGTGPQHDGEALRS
jgi:hypothetical protein